MEALDKLAPFLASTKEAAAREYVRSVAQSWVWNPHRTTSNLLISSPRAARRSADDPLTATSICLAREETRNAFMNFAADPIKGRKRWRLVKADGTTLGADNGVGVAAALREWKALTLIASGCFHHDEETGLTALEFPLAR